MTRPKCQQIELRVSVLLPSGNRTSKKYTHATAATNYVNFIIERWPGALVDIDQRVCEPWTPSLLASLIPDQHRWVR